MHLRRRPFASLPGVLAVFSLAAFSFVLTGCGGGMGAQASPPAAIPAMHGTVFGGQQPVSGASIQLYEAGSTGYGSAASARLITPVTSDAGGGFSITGDYTCLNNADQVYIVATGGNPGLAPLTNNPSLALMAALSNCGTLLTNASTTHINVTELTTVASVYALAQFMGPGTATNGGTLLGTSAGNAAGLRNAFATVNTLVNTTSGLAPGASLPAGTTVPISELNTLADILAGCVNTNGLTGECTNLFTATTVGSFTPTNTIDAMLAIALNPGLSPTTLYSLLPASPPFQPTLVAAPNDWTVGVQYTGNGMANPWGVAIDGSGNVFTANHANSTASKFLNTGVPVVNFNGGGLSGPAFVAIDSNENVYFTNNLGGANSISEFSNAGGANINSPYTTGGLNLPYDVAIDSLFHLWITNNGADVVSHFDNFGNPLSVTGFSGGGLTSPNAVAIDSTNNVWVTNFNGASLTEFDNTGAPLSGPGFTGGGLSLPDGIAIDHSNNVWVSNQNNALSEFDNTGTALSGTGGFTGGGLNIPTRVVIDGLGRPWVSNQGPGGLTGSISEFDTTGAALSPSTGFVASVTLNGPQDLAIDGSGNLWVTSYGSDSLIKVVGVAAPVVTPLATAVANGQLGQEP